MIKTAFQLKTVGNLLKERRKEKGLTIQQVSEAIKIRGEYLIALEKGNYSAFPSEVYIKGFLRNYSKFLNISTDQALALYRRENESRAETGPVDVVNKLKEKGFGLTFTPNRVIAIVAGIALLVVVIYLSTYVGRILKKPDLQLTSPVAAQTEQEGTFRTDGNFIEIVGEVELGSRLRINGQELKLNNFEKFSKQFKIEEGTNKFTIKAENQFGRESQIILNVIKGGSTSTTPANLQISAQFEIINQATNVTVTVDGEIKNDSNLAIGQQMEFTASNSFEILTPRPSSVNLVVNGQTQTIGATGSKWAIINGELVKQ